MSFLRGYWRFSPDHTDLWRGGVSKLRGHPLSSCVLENHAPGRGGVVWADTFVLALSMSPFSLQFTSV
jgi:hypothetical protein